MGRYPSRRREALILASDRGSIRGGFRAGRLITGGLLVRPSRCHSGFAGLGRGEQSERVMASHPGLS